MTPIYSVKNMLKTIPGAKSYRILVRSLRVAKGDKIAITGPSGCGKSTTLDMLGLSLKPDSSDLFDFRPSEASFDIQTLWEDGKLDALADLRREYLGYVLQSGELIPCLAVWENMILTARMAGMDKTEAIGRAETLAAKLGIMDQWRATPSTLSVGQRQRVAIVRALCAAPPVILADEPTAALDPSSALGVMEALLDAIETYGAALILVTHNEAWAKSGNLRAIPFSIISENGVATAELDDGSEDEPIR